MRAAEHDTMHYCFVWKKWQWPVWLRMEANLCLNTGGGRVVRGELSAGRRRRQAVNWELDQWQVNPLWRKPFIFVKAFLLEIPRGPEGQRLGRRCRSDGNWLFYWEHWNLLGLYHSLSPDGYLDEGRQQHAAHFLLQDDLVVLVVVAGRDERGEQHSDQLRVAEVLEGQLTEFLQDAGLAARLHDHLQHTANGISQSRVA